MYKKKTSSSVEGYKYPAYTIPAATYAPLTYSTAYAPSVPI